MACERLGCVPEQWSEAWITMIPKGRVVHEDGVHSIDISSAPCTPDRLRPISILSIPWRVMMRCRATQVAEWQEPLLHDWQHGARRKHGTKQCIAQTYHLLETAMRGLVGSSPLHGLTIDISKCFDSIPLEAVQQAWIHAGLEPAFARSWCGMWSQIQRRFRLPNSILGSPFAAKRGLPQGDPMSTIACNIVFAGLCRLLQAEAIQSGIEVHVSNYLDDMIVLVTQPFHLQIVRKVLADFVDKFAIRLNEKKSYVFSTSNEVADHWRAHGSPINFAVADTLHLLGTELSLRGALPYAASTTEEKVGKVCKRLRRVMLLPVAKSTKAGLIGNGCLSILGYCPVRPLPDQKTINLLRSWNLWGLALRRAVRSTACTPFTMGLKPLFQAESDECQLLLFLVYDSAAARVVGTQKGVLQVGLWQLIVLCLNTPGPGFLSALSSESTEVCHPNGVRQQQAANSERPQGYFVILHGSVITPTTYIDRS
eukprot:5049810-Amphidinium_carterae.1